MLAIVLQITGAVIGLSCITYGFFITAKDWIDDEKERSFEEHVEELIELIKEK